MSIGLILTLTGVQFVVQTTLWGLVEDYTMSFIKSLDKHFSEQTQRKVGSIILIAENIGISLLVLAFTSVGVIAGITNLFASALLGILMYRSLKGINKEPLINRIMKVVKGEQYEETVFAV